MNDDIFKKCTSCGKIWTSRASFMADPNIEIQGYQVHFEDLTSGLFYFDHTTKNCGTTLALNASIFRDLYKGPIFEERKTGTGECPGYCLKKNELRPCPAKCECAYVREIIQIIKNRPKANT